MRLLEYSNSTFIAQSDHAKFHTIMQEHSCDFFLKKMRISLAGSDNSDWDI
jgi:hypothetical protein